MRLKRVDGRVKVQDEQEIVRWYQDGWTYQEMVDEYRRKYNMEVSISMFSGVRRRLGLERRILRNQNLIPWIIAPAHRTAYDLNLLRMEARRREGRKLRNGDMGRLNKWLEWMADEGVVVHYDADTVEGFYYIPRRPGIDTDIIRRPERVESRAPLI